MQELLACVRFYFKEKRMVVNYIIFLGLVLDLFRDSYLLVGLQYILSLKSLGHCYSRVNLLSLVEKRLDNLFLVLAIRYLTTIGVLQEKLSYMHKQVC